MVDIMLCESGEYEGDLDITETGDIQLGSNPLQDAKTAVAWISGEWRLGPEIGLPWFEEFLVKNANLDLVRQEIIDAVLEIDGITDADVEILEYDQKNRKMSLSLSCTTDDETYSGEVTVGG